jgi:hypothetical protein
MITISTIKLTYHPVRVWVQTEITVRLAIAYFNWIWVHSRKENTAAQRAELAIAPWSWNDLITYPTLY